MPLNGFRIFVDTATKRQLRLHEVRCVDKWLVIRSGLEVWRILPGLEIIINVVTWVCVDYWESLLMDGGGVDCDLCDDWETMQTKWE